MFVLTQEGLFLAFDLHKMASFYRKDYEKTANEVFCLKASNRILVILDKQIHGLEYRPNNPPGHAYEPVGTLFKELKGEIHAVHVSPNEQILAVSTLSGNAPLVEIYRIGP
jgi:hypothetical protein